MARGRSLVRLVVALVAASSLLVALPSPAVGESGPFEDVAADHLFVDAVAWLGDQGITKGCNPPHNTEFCPDDPVTREQMAAFLGRLMFYVDGAGSDVFTDDDGSVFEADIERLAHVGVTKGCNPPINDQFCPKSVVTRGQMAAFMVRALDLTDDGGGNSFIDDDGSVFEADIAKLATAGITKGCNPPVNDQFCPDSVVTRGQMAAFMWRAVGEPDAGEPGVNRVDAKTTVVIGSDNVVEGAADSAGLGTVTLEAGSAVPAVGKYVVVKPSPGLPNGLVGQVTAVDGLVVSTVPVALSVVIPEGEIHATVTDALAVLDTESGLVEQNISVGELLGFACDLTNVDVDLELGGSVALNFDAEWGLFKEDFVRATIDLEIGVGAEGGGGIQGTCQRNLLPTLVLPPVPLPLGLTMTPKVDWIAEVSGGIEAFAFDVGYGQTSSVGFEWREGNISPVWEFDFGATGTGLSTDYPHSYAEFFTGLKITAEIWGVVGLFIQGGVFIGYDSNGPNDLPFWTAEAGLEISGGFEVDFFIFDVSATLAEVRLATRVIASGEAEEPPPPPPGPLTIVTSALADGVLDEPYTDKLQATGGTPPYVWSVADGTLPPGINMEAADGGIGGVPTSAATWEFTVEVTDAAGGSDTRDLTVEIHETGGMLISPPTTQVSWINDSLCCYSMDYEDEVLTASSNNALFGGVLYANGISSDTGWSGTFSSVPDPTSVGELTGSHALGLPYLAAQSTEPLTGDATFPRHNALDVYELVDGGFVHTARLIDEIETVGDDNAVTNPAFGSFEAGGGRVAVTRFVQDEYPWDEPFVEIYGPTGGSWEVLDSMTGSVVWLSQTLIVVWDAYSTDGPRLRIGDLTAEGSIERITDFPTTHCCLIDAVVDSTTGDVVAAGLDGQQSVSVFGQDIDGEWLEILSTSVPMVSNESPVYIVDISADNSLVALSLFVSGDADYVEISIFDVSEGQAIYHGSIAAENGSAGAITLSAQYLLVTAHSDGVWAHALGALG